MTAIGLEFGGEQLTGYFTFAYPLFLESIPRTGACLLAHQFKEMFSFGGS